MIQHKHCHDLSGPVVDNACAACAGVTETVLRFHKTKIVRIRPNGDFMLTSGGWHTATTGKQGPCRLCSVYLCTDNF
jgi:hypothetical protein